MPFSSIDIVWQRGRRVRQTLSKTMKRIKVIIKFKFNFNKLFYCTNAGF
jgi:hypothetical protein